MGISELLDRHDITQKDFGVAIGLKPPALNKKLKGTRAWKVAEVGRVLDFFRRTLKNDGLTFEDVFGGAPKRKRPRKVAA